MRGGSYDSVSEIMQEHVRDMIVAEHDKGDEFDPAWAMRHEIRRRMGTPGDQWLSEDEFEKHFDKLLRCADDQIRAGR